MTMTTSPPKMIDEPTTATLVSWSISDLAAMTRRDMIRTARQPEMLTFGVVMGVFFLLLFNYVFGGAIGAGTGVDYVQFLVPGVFVITALTGAQQTGSGLALDLSEGVTERFRSLPMSQFAVIGGRTIADGLRNVVAVILVAGVGYLLGFRFATFGGAVVAMLLIVGLGYAFSWVNAAIAAKIQNAEMVGMLSMFWLFPLMFASSAFTPTSQMSGWLRAFADNQPISVVADATRLLCLGEPAGTSIVASVLWIAGLTAGFAVLAIRLYGRTS